MQVQVLPGADSDLEKMGYSWDILGMDKRSLDLQVTFENPLYISVSEESEELLVNFNDGSAFLSDVGLPLNLAQDDDLEEH